MQDGKVAQNGLTPAPQVPRSGKFRMLLVGMTGHGKSRLGSFLMSPEDTFSIKQAAFEFSEECKASTQIITAKPLIENGIPFELVDTPGFGEKAGKDREHTLQAVKYLKSAQEISAVVFVYK